MSEIEEPNYSEILRRKIDYYGETQAAYHFAADEYAREYISQYKAKVEELEKELKRKQIEWKNQRDTICNFHDVYKKHFGLDDMACSQNLDEKLTSLKQEKERLVELLNKNFTALDLMIKPERRGMSRPEIFYNANKVFDETQLFLSSLSKQNK